MGKDTSESEFTANALLRRLEYYPDIMYSHSMQKMLKDYNDVIKEAKNIEKVSGKPIPKSIIDAMVKLKDGLTKVGKLRVEIIDGLVKYLYYYGTPKVIQNIRVNTNSIMEKE